MKLLEVIRKFPGRVIDALSDPIRRKHVAGQCVLTTVSGVVALGWYVYGPHPWCLLAPSVGTVTNFVLYEFVGEVFFPGWFGPYWERGPRDGETFERP